MPVITYNHCRPMLHQSLHYWSRKKNLWTVNYDYPYILQRSSNNPYFSLPSGAYGNPELTILYTQLGRIAKV